MTLINKQELPQVAAQFMNDVHDEDIDIINELYALIQKYESDPTLVNEELLNAQYQKWFEHTVAHFKGEEEKMLELNFPPYPMHKGEHENALQVMDDVFRTWQSSKDIDVLKNYISQELPEWLRNHIQTMDTITAMFFETGLSPCAAH